MADKYDIEGEIWADDAAARPSADSDPDPATLDGRAHALWRDLWLATAFLTRLPVPTVFVPPAHRDGTGPVLPLAVAARAFPLVGVIVGLIGAVGIWVGAMLGLHPFALAMMCLGAAALATGALHEDGLADVADGFGGGRDAPEKLDILRDSRIGTYGVLALLLGIGLRAGALMSFISPAQAAFAFVAAAAISRAGLPLMMHLMEPARKDGLGFDAGRPDQTGVIVAVAVAVLIGFLCVGFAATVMGVLFAGAAMGAVALLANRQIGGLTGDVLGAAQQAGEIAVLLAAVWVLA